MATPAAFSRLQLAAALLEYDNDLDNPDSPRRSAQDSAIFAHLRRNPAARPDLGTRKSDFLGVPLPSETASLRGRESALDSRRSRASRGSMDALRNPFGHDGISELEHNEEEEEDTEEALEVDLASWGLDAFIPKDKKSAKARGKQPAVNSTHSRIPSTRYDSSATAPRRGVVTSKAMSVGGHMEFDNVTLDRRRSYGSPLDLAGVEATDLSLPRQTSMLPEQDMIPFPTGSIRAPSPGVEQVYDGKPALHARTYSTTSMNSKIRLDAGLETGGRQRSNSIGTLDMLKPVEENPFAIEHSAHTSRFDPKAAARARSPSNASMGSRMMLDNDDMSMMTGDPYARERPYSTLELLRPKVLVMPSPLQSISPHLNPQPARSFRDGFEISTDGPPLPPGARTSRRLSSVSAFDVGAENVPVASNSFIPNPLVDLSLSQKTFRNTLMVDGSLSPYSNLDIPRATEDGEQVQLEPSRPEEALTMEIADELPSQGSRPAGKLYGKSLIDDLENRKAQLRSKQRVFTGDQRPSMMARNQQRSSTLIDPASLQARPASQRLSSYGSQNTQPPALTRRLSTKPPLLNFDEDGAQGTPPSPARLASSRSVFGVDTLWEREMVKLREIQAKEEADDVERRKAEAEAERRRQEKERKKRKKKGRPDVEVEEVIEKLEGTTITLEPPVLPVIERATRRAPPKPSDSDLSSDSDDDSPMHATSKTVPSAPSWHVGSSDEDEDGPRRTTGVGPRYPKQGLKLVAPPADEDSEEDLPLAATIHKAVARATFSGSNVFAQDFDDEDQPLSRVLQTKSTASPSRARPPPNRGQPLDEDEDDEPLGLRASRIPPSNHNGGNEDDMPLAFHPEQQRRTQYQMLAQHQQQQQMMMQARMQSAMMMNASMMGSLYGPPMMTPMGMMPMQLPIPIPSPPPMADEASFGRVDRWRRDVVVDE